MRDYPENEHLFAIAAMTGNKRLLYINSDDDSREQFLMDLAWHPSMQRTQAGDDQVVVVAHSGDFKANARGTPFDVVIWDERVELTNEVYESDVQACLASRSGILLHLEQED